MPKAETIYTPWLHDLLVAAEGLTGPVKTVSAYTTRNGRKRLLLLYARGAFSIEIALDPEEFDIHEREYRYAP